MFFKKEKKNNLVQFVNKSYPYDGLHTCLATKHVFLWQVTFLRTGTYFIENVLSFEDPSAISTNRAKYLNLLPHNSLEEWSYKYLYINKKTQIVTLMCVRYQNLML